MVACLLAVITVLTGVVALPSGSVAARPSSAVSARAARTATPYDRTIGPLDCRLLGRTYAAGRGCSRDLCLPAAHAFKGAEDAEVCALRHQGDHAFASAVDYRRCAMLHRRWIPQVNWCAANPDRRVAVVTHAPQCTGRHSTYVTLTDTEPTYDECLRPSEVSALVAEAHRERVSLAREAARRSRLLCSYWPAHTFTQGRCVAGTPPGQTRGGVLVVGDSIAWRGTDELGPLRPDWTLDGYPGRRFRDLEQRLSWFEAAHGAPDGLILELGTNASHGFTRGQLIGILDGLPAATVIMLVLPFRADPHGAHGAAPFTTTYSRWMTSIAATRPLTCVADWRALATRHPRTLVDGVHPTSAGEGFWARWISGNWSACTHQ